MLFQNIKRHINNLLGKYNVDNTTSKDIFIGVITSPITFLIITIMVYSIKTIGHFLSLPESNNLLMFKYSVPFLISLLPIVVYCYFIYKYKTFYVSFTGRPVLLLLSIIAFTFMLFLILVSSNLELIGTVLLFASLLLSSILVFFISFSSSKNTLLKLDALNFTKRSKIAFVDLYNYDLSILIFIKKPNIFYQEKYIQINGYKVSYQDVSIFEDQFNKKLYDFNKDELEIMTMYAFN
jgi:hypothetical protein